MLVIYGLVRFTRIFELGELHFLEL
jgi:hypothetical protein